MRSERRMPRKPLAILTALVLGLSSALLAAEQTVTEEQLLEKIEKAGTARDHEALASFYGGQAQAAEEKAVEHETMAAKYANVVGKGDWPTHCRNLAAHYRKVASEYAALAKLHEGRAAELKGN